MQFLFAMESDPIKLDDHLAYMASDVKRNADVSINWLSKADRRKFEDAQSKELTSGLRTPCSASRKELAFPLSE